MSQNYDRVAAVIQAPLVSDLFRNFVFSGILEGLHSAVDLICGLEWLLLCKIALDKPFDAFVFWFSAAFQQESKLNTFLCRILIMILFRCEYRFITQVCIVGTWLQLGSQLCIWNDSYNDKRSNPWFGKYYKFIIAAVTFLPCLWLIMYRFV